MSGASRSDERRTVGVEEELLLFDRGTTRLARLGDELSDVTAEGEDVALPSVEHEFKRQQIETATSPQVEVSRLREEMAQGRRTIAERGLGAGVAPAALGADPAPGRPAPTDDERYQRMMTEFATVAAQQLTCGMHVHVGVSSRDEGVAVLDRIRVWLPVLLALSANSSFSQGVDTGYASYRSVSWGGWPTAGPTEEFGSVAAYDHEVEDLVRSGAALDVGMIYFDARLAVAFPTVEVRAMDVVPTPDEAALLAALVRGLVETAAREWRGGTPTPGVRRSLLRAATWRAARFGLTDTLVRPSQGGRVATAAAAVVVDELLQHVDAALRDAGDADLVADGVRRLMAEGTGAERQRAAYARRHDIADVVAAAVAWTS